MNDIYIIVNAIRRVVDATADKVHTAVQLLANHERRLARIEESQFGENFTPESNTSVVGIVEKQ